MRILEKLADCPGIIRLLNKPTQQNPTLIFEYAPTTLREIIPKISLAEAGNIIMQIIEAIECMHRRGIVHGDLNTNNILIGEDGKIRIIDFEGAALRSMGKKTYTPKYAAPEQIYGEYGEISEKTDIFQLGTIIYEIYEGKQAFTEDWEAEILLGEHQPYRKTPEPIRKVIDKCLQPEQEKRWPNTMLLKKALKIATKKATERQSIPIGIDLLPPIERVLRILETYKNRGYTTIGEIAENTGLEPQTVVDIIREIPRQDIVAIGEKIYYLDNPTQELIVEAIRLATKGTPLAHTLRKPQLILQALQIIGKTGTIVTLGTINIEPPTNIEIIGDTAIPKITLQHILQTTEKYRGQLVQDIVQKIAKLYQTTPQTIQKILRAHNKVETILERIFEYKCEGTVLSVAFSPDGRYLATGSWGNVLRVFEIGSWKKVYRHKHGAAILSLSFSPDSKYLATGGRDNMLRVFETTTWRIIYKHNHEYDIFSVAFSPENKYLATGSWDGILRVFKIGSWEIIFEYKHKSPVYSVAFSPDGRLLATGSKDKMLRVFEVNSWRRIFEYKHVGGVVSVAFSPDGKLLATGSWDYMLRVFSFIDVII